MENTSTWEFASPLEHCGEEDPHGPHEWLLSMRRTQCPGTAVPEPRELDSVDRKVLTLLYRGIQDAYRPQRYDRDEDDE